MSLTTMKTVESLAQDRIVLRTYIAEFSEAIDTLPPEHWWKSIARRLIRFERNLVNFQSTELQEYLLYEISKIKQLLRDSQHSDVNTSQEIIAYTEQQMMELSMRMAMRFEEQNVSIESKTVSLDHLIENHSDRIRKKDTVLNGVQIIELSIRHPVNEQWYTIPLPTQQHIWHKGGPARAVLNILADAPLSMQLAEFPWNDFDVITAGNPEANYKTSIAIGVDPDGVEYMGESQLNFARFALGRDTDQNQCCLGADGLHYSEVAFKAAQTGHISIVGQYIANKAIYGVDSMFMQGISLIKARGLMRLVKNVVEGKALSFDYKPVNANFDIGIYVLFLAKKWSGRANFPELLQKLYLLLQQMGQINEGETSIIEVLERAHRTYAFFDFDREIRTKEDLTQWKGRKLIKQIDRETAWIFGFPATMNLQRESTDETSIVIALPNVSYSATEADQIKLWWPTFVAECQTRTAIIYAKGMSQYERIFMKDNDVSPDDASSIIDDD